MIESTSEPAGAPFVLPLILRVGGEEGERGKQASDGRLRVDKCGRGRLVAATQRRIATEARGFRAGSLYKSISLLWSIESICRRTDGRIEVHWLCSTSIWVHVLSKVAVQDTARESMQLGFSWRSLSSSQSDNGGSSPLDDGIDSPRGHVAVSRGDAGDRRVKFAVQNAPPSPLLYRANARRHDTEQSSLEPASPRQHTRQRERNQSLISKTTTRKQLKPNGSPRRRLNRAKGAKSIRCNDLAKFGE